MTDATSHANRNKPYPAQIQPGKFESSSLPSVTDYNRELYRVRASWLVDLFPDELVIQEKTVSAIRNHMLVSYIETIPVKDIGRVVYVDTPFFSGIQVIGKNPVHELSIKGLPKKQASVAKDILDGLLLERAGELEAPEWMHIDTRRQTLEQGGGQSPDRHRQT